MYRDIAHHAYRRGQEAMTTYELPNWALALGFLNLMIIIPFFFFMGYAVNDLYPVLAMIEDPDSPPSYEPVALSDDDAAAAHQQPKKATDPRRAADTEAAPVGPVGPATASLRRVYRTLKSVGGIRSNFRGLACFFFMAFASTCLAGIFSLGGMIPLVFVVPFTAIAMSQFYTAWVHIVISQPSPKRFWQRLPPFKKSFQATALPIVMYFCAAEIASWAPMFVAYLLNLNVWSPRDPSHLPEHQSSDLPKGMLVLLVSLLLKVLLVIPAHVVLVRIQASLLPEEDETIVPFDRSFQSRVEPAIVGGKGFLTIKDAWATITREAWVRIIKLYVKGFFAVMGAALAFSLILVPQMIFIYAHTKEIDQ